MTESLLYSLSLDLGQTGKSQPSVVHGPAEVMFFNVAWTSEKPVLSCGLRGLKLCICGGKEITHGPAASPNCVLYVLLFGVEAYCHWLWQEFLFLFSGYVDRSGMLPSPRSSGRDVLLRVFCSGKHYSHRNETQPKHWACLGTKIFKVVFTVDF